jgi:hypothetical protein
MTTLEEYNKMAEENEFFGLPYDEDTDRLIKLFIKELIKQYELPKKRKTQNNNDRRHC